MASRIALVEFTPIKSCFISLPVPWGQEFQRKQNSIFELQWGDRGRAYVSWAGDMVIAAMNNGSTTPTLQINGLYANKLGLCHGEEVLLRPVSAVHHCSRISVEPATSDDWEILELNTGYVESNLLNQVRIVWTGQILPVWIEKKICIFIKIGTTEPNASCVQLQQNTELFVAPKSRRNHTSSRPPAPNLNPLPSRSTVNPDRQGGISPQRDSDKTPSSMGSIVGGGTPSNYTSDYDSATSPSDSTFSTAHLTDGSSGGNTPTQPWSVPPEILDNSIPWSYRVWCRIKSIFFSDEGDTQTAVGVSDMEEARRKMAAEFWKDVRIVARVQPMFERSESAVLRDSSSSGLLASGVDKKPQGPDRKHIAPSSTAQKRPSDAPSPQLPTTDPSPLPNMNSYTHLMQPTTVYLSSDCETEFVRHHNSNTDEHQCPVNAFVTFLAYLSKMPSPREKKEEVNRKFQQTQKKYHEERKTSGSSFSEQQPHLSDPATKDATKTDDINPSCVVRVIIHSNELKRHQNGQSKNVYSSNTFQKRNISWFIQIPDLLRRQLGLEASAKVELRPVLIPPHPIHSIVLFPLFDKPATLTTEDLVFAFEYWVSCVSCMISPIPIKQHGTLLQFPISRTGDIQGEFLISINYQDNANKTDSSMSSTPIDASQTYFLLHPLSAKKSKARILDRMTTSNKPAFIPRMPSLGVSELDNVVCGYRLRDLGGVTVDLGKEAVSYLSTALMTRPLSRSLGESLPGILQGGLLICGPRGSGKSTLGRSVCREMMAWPNLAHVSLVECKQLKGKRIETIRKIWEEAMNEAAWRQPSIILLDDLDHVTASPLGPEQEIGPEAVYHTRVAEVLKDIMMAEVKEGSQVCILATTRSKGTLHQSLTSSRGCHLFQSCLEIPSLNKEQRVEVFNSAVRSKVEVDLRTFDHVDAAALMSLMEGYVARDVVTVVERAIHAGCSREMVEGRPRLDPTPHERPAQDPNVEEILLIQEDFEVALLDYTPATLRDVPLHSAGELGWDDVGGLRDVKESLLETLQLPAKYPVLFANCPLRLRSGLLLYGPPGTGKTLLGGVVARECGLNFISIKGPELLSKYIGASEQAVRDLFNRAQSAKPCILFFDEFDSLAPRRGHDSTGVTDRVVNQLLTQLDGVEGLQGVYVIGATSRPDLIDPALLRPGRLDKCLFCPIPGTDERLEILQALTRKIPLTNDVNLHAVAAQCEHFTGADFKALLYNAQLDAIHATLSNPDPDSDYDPPMILSKKQCSMGADEWKLTFMESFSADGDYMGNNADDVNAREDDVTSRSPSRRLRRDNGNSVHFGSPRRSATGSESSNNSMDFVQVNIQDLKSDGVSLAEGRVVAEDNPGSDGRLEVKGHSSDGRSDVKGHGPSLKKLAAVKRGSTTTTKPRMSDIIGDSIENEEVPGPMEGLDDAFYTSTRQWGEQQVIYMPTLRDGVVDPSKDTQEKINSQIAVIKENYRQRTNRLQGYQNERSKSIDGSAVIHISQAHLLRAAADMKPSVTFSERARYQSIYERFVQSRGGNFNPTPQQQAGQKRATLA
ncbi:peroxisomal ATPase PEX1-like isoform X1 [Asterias amurensis]|uniref:peroxisomal ATPase PEX1-like isoform X1 n=1 Tax=Asterias amurensis TaxID=7602 RepID=UPI003AB5A70A